MKKNSGKNLLGIKPVFKIGSYFRKIMFHIIRDNNPKDLWRGKDGYKCLDNPYWWGGRGIFDCI